MARKITLVSDLSGAAIADNQGATVTIKYTDARRGVYVLDVTDAEAEDLAQHGRKQARRGRKPKGSE